MRNLKRALSLALASVMVVGMMVVSAGAASYDKFTDKADIVNKDAVSRVTELGIIAGLTDGSFGPTKNIDRASFARLICVALNGGKEPMLGNITTTFKDTKGNWAEKYIAYCVEKGIIAGKGNNTFAPSANVTGSEAAKMLLVALGYNASYENIGGATWQITTDVLANQAGLYNDLSNMNTSTALTRDNAAQMISNALDATMVKYEMITGVTTTGQVTITPQRVNKTKTVNGTTSAITMLEDAFNAIKVEGVVLANEYADLTSTNEKGSALDAGKTRISVTNTEDQSVFKSGNYSVSTDASVLGRAVTLYVKNDASSSSKATVLGTAILDDDNKVVVKAAKKDLADLADDNDLNMVSATKVVFNYTNPIDWSKLTADQKAAAKARGVEKILIDSDDNGDVDYALVNTMYFGQVTKHSTSSDGSITVNAGKVGNLSADNKKDVVGFDDVKKDDYVLAAWIGGDLVVKKAESVTGTLKAFKADESLTVDGTKYDVSQVEGFTGGTDGIITAKTVASSNLDNKATFYLDVNGMIVAMGDAVESSYNYAYVWASDIGGGVDNNRVKVTLQDGTTKTYDLADKSEEPKLSTDTTSGTNTANRVFAYTINSDGEIKLSNPSNGWAKSSGSNNTSFDKNKTTVSNLSIDANKQTSYASTNTAFFYVSLKADKKTIDSVDVYTGYKSAPSASGIAAEAAYNSGEKMAAVAFTGAAIKSKDVDEHLYVTDILSHSSKQTTVKAVLAGTDTEVEIQVDDSAFKTEGMYLYSTDSKGVYTLNDASNATNNYVATTGSKAVANISNTTLVADGKEYKLTSKTVLIQLQDDGDFDAASVGTLPNNDEKAEVTAILVNGDDELLMIVQKDAATPTTPVNPSGDFKGETTLALDNKAGTATFKFYKNAPSAQTVTSMLKSADATIASVDTTAGVTDGKAVVVTYKDGSKANLTLAVVEMFKVSYNGTQLGYFAKDAKVAIKENAVVIDGVTATDKVVIADGKYTVTNKDVALVDAAKVTLTNVTATYGSATSVTNGHYVAVGTLLNLTSVGNNDTHVIKANDAVITGSVASTTTAPATATYTMSNVDVTFTFVAP